MKAAVFKGVGKPFSIENVPDPTPGSGQVVLKVGRCGACGSDLHMTEYHGAAMPVGSVMGHEFAGEVVAIGHGVENVRIGDRMAAMPFQGCGKCKRCLSGRSYLCKSRQSCSAGFAEYTLAGANECVKLPSSLSLADGALVEPLAVGLHGVKISGMPLGARVLVMGAGAIGLAAAHYARRLGAGTIVMLAASRRREAQAMAMGVDKFVVAEAGEDPVAAVSRAFGDTTLKTQPGDAAGGRPIAAAENAMAGVVDIVFEAVGVPGMVTQAINHVRPEGTVVVLSWCMQADQWVPGFAMLKEVRVQFSAVYDTSDFEYVVRLLDEGRLEPRTMITQTVSFKDFPAAFEALKHRSPQCKLQLDPTL